MQWFNFHDRDEIGGDNDNNNDEGGGGDDEVSKGRWWLWGLMDADRGEMIVRWWVMI